MKIRTFNITMTSIMCIGCLLIGSIIAIAPSTLWMILAATLGGAGIVFWIIILVIANKKARRGKENE